MRLSADMQIELIRKVLQQLIAVRREARTDHDALGEAADASAIFGQHAEHEVLRAFDGAVELRHHAGRSVDHEHGAQRLGGDRELRDRLRPAVVQDLELVLRQIQHEAGLRIAHGHVDRHDVGAGLEDLRRRGHDGRRLCLLWMRPNRHGQGSDDEQHAGTNARCRMAEHRSSPALAITSYRVTPGAPGAAGYARYARFVEGAFAGQLVLSPPQSWAQSPRHRHP